MECKHGEPKGERYCALCRFESPSRPKVDRQVVAVHKNAQETSRLAAQKVLPRTGTKRKIIFDLIQESGLFGLCDHEIEQRTGWLHQSASSVRNSLMKDGWLKDSGLRRTTPQGNPAICWVLA